MEELKERIKELEKENKMLLDCLNGSTKATYTAEMYDKEMRRIAIRCAGIAKLYGDEVILKAIAQEFNLPKAG